MVLISGGEDDDVDVFGARPIGENQVVAIESANPRLHYHFAAENRSVQTVVDHLLAWNGLNE